MEDTDEDPVNPRGSRDCSLPFTSVWAENMTPEDIKKLVDEAVNKRMQEHERREGATERDGTESRRRPARSIRWTGTMTDVGGSSGLDEETVPLSFGSTGSGRLVYAKPFVTAPKAIVGGYMDIQYRSQRKASIENGYGGSHQWLRPAAIRALHLCRHY